MSDTLELLDTSPENLADYHVLKHLGSGATADVFKVICRENKRHYVLKQMPLENMTDEEKLRAKQEILVMDGVDHPNVVKFHESFSSDSSVDIVMECCDGGTLEQLIERQRHEGTPFPEAVLIEWMAELLCALAHIHSKRILHRDLKTSNIFVTAKNHLKLGDFGVCTILTNANAMAESMIGTPLYFAPEVCENEAYDERSDVWSLGIVFYEMCTLRRPFEADNLFSLISKILTQDVAPFATGLEMTFEEIVRSMLSKDPRNRPTAQELIDVHLNVPRSHPSHPSQKPSRSRLVQQYYGPELTYKKRWPPVPSPQPKDPTGQPPASPAADDIATTQTSAANKASGDVKKYVSNEKDRAKYTELLNQTMGALLKTETTTGTTTRVVATPRRHSPQTSAIPTNSSTPRPEASAVDRKLPKRPPRTSVSKAPSLPASKARERKVIKKATAATSHEKSERATPASTRSASLYKMASSTESIPTVHLDELKMDLARRRGEMFGEQGLSLNEVPIVIELGEESIDALEVSERGRVSSFLNHSASVRVSSSFLEDVAAVLERHTRGRTIKLDELDDAAQLLSQYKLSNYGMF